MRLNIEIATNDGIISQEDVKSLVETINNNPEIQSDGGIVRLPAPRLGEFRSIDPTLWKIIVDVANIGAISVTVKGIFDIIIEWQKNRNQKMNIKIGDVSLDIPVSISNDKISYITDKVSSIAKLLEEKAKDQKMSDENLDNQKTTKKQIEQ